MGSNFFKTMLNPLSTPGQHLIGLAGPNSAVGKWAANDKLLSSGFMTKGAGKALNPAGAQQAANYDAMNHPAPSPGGAFKGVDPTLADANNSYVKAAGVALPQQKPLPVMAQPQRPQVMSLYGSQGNLYGQ
jgi:hypothetical protein